MTESPFSEQQSSVTIPAPKDWEEYYLDIAKVVSTKSKDPHTKVGAVLVNNHVTLTGYNGFPFGVKDYVHRWSREEGEKYKWVCHAEANVVCAAARNGVKTDGGTLYISHFPPCEDCAKLIIQAGIKEIVCGNGKLSPTTIKKCQISLDMFKECGLKISLNSSLPF